jgi:hypothetical protein
MRGAGYFFIPFGVSADCLIGSWPYGSSRDHDTVGYFLAKRRSSARSEPADGIELTAVLTCARDSALPSLKLRHIPSRSNWFAERIPLAIHGDHHFCIGLAPVFAIKRSRAIEIFDLVLIVAHDSSPD